MQRGGSIQKKIMKTKKGTTLIEALAFLFIFSVITTTFYSAWSLGTSYILLAKNRLVATALANEKLEVIRNLKFEDIAHTTGVPAGNLLQDEDVVRSGGTYHVHTQIVSRDDPFDGTLAGGMDTNFVDYKDVKLTISWGNAGQSVSLSSRFVPAGIEQSAAGLGILVINVTSDKDGGALVSGATVRVQNTSIGYDETNTTDSLGRLVLVGVPAGIKNYQITVSKSGYETVFTLPDGTTTVAPYPSATYTPTHGHASVVELAINTANIYLNKTANLTVETKDFLGADVPDMNFHLEGGRVLGVNDVDLATKYYSTNVKDATDGSGEYDFGSVSPGPYVFTFEEAGYEVIGMNRTPSFTLTPDETATLTVKVSPDTATGALFIIQNDTDSSPIAGASVHLTQASAVPPYDRTVTTDVVGDAFFPDPSDTLPFASGSYDYTVQAPGYADVTGSVTVSGGSIKTETVPLTAS